MPVFVFINGLLALNGLMLYASYRDCDPLLDGRIELRDQVCEVLVWTVYGLIKVSRLDGANICV